MKGQRGIGAKGQRCIGAKGQKGERCIGAKANFRMAYNYSRQGKFWIPAFAGMTQKIVAGLIKTAVYSRYRVSFVFMGGAA